MSKKKHLDEFAFLTTCYPTVSSGVYGNSGDKMSKEYVQCSEKG